MVHTGNQQSKWMRQEDHKFEASLDYTFFCQALVAHIYNPNYSEGRDQENCSLKPAQANSLGDPSSEKTNKQTKKQKNIKKKQKKGWWWLKVQAPIQQQQKEAILELDPPSFP
jgi:hypothetical protein